MKPVAKVAMIAAGPAAVSMFEAPAIHAAADAPWCAVINLSMGDVHWDCRYHTVEECVPNLVSERGTCSPNRYASSSAAIAVPGKLHAKYRSNVDYVAALRGLRHRA